MAFPNGQLQQVLREEEKKAAKAVQIASKKEELVVQGPAQQMDVKEISVDVNVEDVEIRIRKRVGRFV